MLCHATEKSRLTLACATDHSLETSCPHAHKVAHTEDFGQVAFTIDARPDCPIHLTKYMVYHTSQTASAEELCGRAEWTMDRVVTQGFQQLLASQEQYMDDFWRRSDVRVRDIREERTKRSTVEIQQAIRFNLFHILQASARAEDAGVPAKGLTGQAYEGHYFWDTEIYLLPFLTYTSPRIAKNLLTFRYKMLPQARAHASQLGHRGAMFPWRTINGEEASAYYAAGTAQYHINADIMFALRKYVQATGDESFLEDCGAEMLVETARLWLDLGFYSDAKEGKFCRIDIAQYFGSREGHSPAAVGCGWPKTGLATRPMRRAPARQMTRNPAKDTFLLRRSRLAKAIRYGMAALLMDPANVGGNVKDGCHIASMRGTWTMLIYGLGGMRDDDGMLSFWPRRAPEDNATLRFPVTYRGQMLDVEIGIDKVEYALREGGCLVIRHETEEIQLTRQQPCRSAGQQVVKGSNCGLS